MLTSLLVEFRKLKGSLILVLCMVAPSLVTVLVGAIALRTPNMDWDFMFTGSTGLWSFFVLPMTVTAERRRPAARPGAAWALFPSSRPAWVLPAPPGLTR